MSVRCNGCGLRLSHGDQRCSKHLPGCVQETHVNIDEDDDLVDVFDITEAEPDLLFINPFGCQVDPLSWRELQVCQRSPGCPSAQTYELAHCTAHVEGILSVGCVAYVLSSFLQLCMPTYGTLASQCVRCGAN